MSKKNLRLSGKDKIEMLSGLSTMLAAGIPLLEAVDSLKEEGKPNVRKVLDELHTSLGEGKPISTALADMPNVFDPLVVNLIKTAEEAGTLEATLKDITANLRKQLELRDQIRASLIYPLFVILIFVGVLVLIMTFVVPRISKVFTDLRVELPPATKLLISSSDIFMSYYPFLIVGAVGLVMAVVVLYKTHRRSLIAFFLSLPGFKQLGRNIDLAYFTRSMHLLLNSGVAIAEALDLAEEVVVKREVRAAIAEMRLGVNEGKPLSDGLRTMKSAPPMMIRMIQTGEQAGTLEAAFGELSEHFATQVNRTLKTLTALLEPLLLVLIGLMVGAMMMAIIAPIYGLVNQITTT